MDFVYGPDQQRWYTELLSGDTITRSTVYVGNYEKITEEGKKGGNAADCKKNGAMHPYLSFYAYLCRRLMGNGLPCGGQRLPSGCGSLCRPAGLSPYSPCYRAEE